ncbi:MAG: hypothetical protein AYK19_11215 [Theionarchaea archaeon DG-70-1]|nr:MAG: hypothetical protein AYK19_11215 [Theionarchaea archaeon DG-70-1]
MIFISEERRTDNLLMRIMLETIQNVVGENGLKSILNYAHLEKYIDNFPPDNDLLEVPAADLHNARLSLIELFGQRGTRGLELRVGREMIRLFLKKRAGVTGILEVVGHLFPESKRMRIGLEKFMEQMEQRHPSPVIPRLELQEKKDYFLLIDRDFLGSEGVASLEPVCNVYVGMLQHLMERATGHSHEVEEIECRAVGHPADVFKITKARKGRSSYRR